MVLIKIKDIEIWNTQKLKINGIIHCYSTKIKDKIIQL